MEIKCGICGGVFETSDRRRKYCSKDCSWVAKHIRQSEYRRKHREERNAYAREYYLTHCEELRIRKREYYLAHREERRAYSREYCRKHREERKAYAHEYRRARLGKSREEWKAGRDSLETAALADVKPAGCPYAEPCLECPNEGGCLFE